MGALNKKERPYAPRAPVANSWLRHWFEDSSLQSLFPGIPRSALAVNFGNYNRSFYLLTYLLTYLLGLLCVGLCKRKLSVSKAAAMAATSARD